MGNVVMLRKNQPVAASEPAVPTGDEIVVLGARMAYAWTETWWKSALAIAWLPLLLSDPVRFSPLRGQPSERAQRDATSRSAIGR